VNKGEFTIALAERTELSKADANRALHSILETLTEAMVEHDEVSFSGWGKFSAQRRKGRAAHDPRNPQRTIHVAPGYVPKFKPGSVLKREINEALPAAVEAAQPAQPGADHRNGHAPDALSGWRPLGAR
jgi:DNA-binding protein HU-beta